MSGGRGAEAHAETGRIRIGMIIRAGCPVTTGAAGRAGSVGPRMTLKRSEGEGNTIRRVSQLAGWFT